MKKRIASVCLALLVCLSLTLPAMAQEQKITVNGETYPLVLQALLSQTQDEVTLRLDSNIQLTSCCIVLGSSDYNGLFGGQVITVPCHNVTIDLNGYTLTGEIDCAVIEVQDAYSLTLVDSSEARTGEVVTRGDAVVVVQDGGSHTPLPEDAAPAQ